MEHISPAENVKFVEALRLLWERVFAKHGFTADIAPTLPKPEAPQNPQIS